MSIRQGSTVSHASAELAAIVARFTQDVAADAGHMLGPAAAGETGTIDLALDPAVLSDLDPPRGISPTGPGPAPSAYRLVVDGDGVRLTAPSAEGVFRGLTTLRQLIAAGLGVDGEAHLDAVRIEDAPRFAWRGLSLDVVRTFFSVSEVERVIDLMALHKLNVLHLHLTDDQGWRIEIPGWPALTKTGASGAVGDRPGGHYSRHEFGQLVAYAAERFITIVPEVDMPGHSAAAIRSYPELAAESGGSLLDPDHPGVLAFAADVVSAMADLAPGPYLHLGGDEAFGMDPEAYRRFIDAARAMAIEAGMTPIFWQEATRSAIGPSDVSQYWLALDPSIEALLANEELVLHGTGLPRDLGIPPEMLPVVAEMVRSSKGDLERAVEAGARILLSPASHLYLDRPYAEDPTDADQKVWQQRLGLKVYPRRSVEETFDWEPDEILPGHEDLIGGIEAAIWCETISSIEQLEFMLLPRLAGVAERAWSHPPRSTWDDHLPRLTAQAPLWRRRGWSFFTSSLVSWEPSW